VVKLNEDIVEYMNVLDQQVQAWGDVPHTWKCLIATLFLLISVNQTNFHNFFYFS
jgi:hypothetical protein